MCFIAFLRRIYFGKFHFINDFITGSFYCTKRGFASAEIAVISMNDSKLAKLAAEGNKRAIRLARLTSQPSRFLSTIQVAITLSGFLGSAFAS